MKEMDVFNEDRIHACARVAGVPKQCADAFEEADSADRKEHREVRLLQPGPDRRYEQIIAGHGRVEAAKLLGIDAVPTCRLSHLSEADKRAYVLADNKLAENAGWDKELLAIELQGLIELDVDIELTGFEMAEIDLILEEAREATGAPSGPEDDVPERSPGPAVTQTGDLWLLGTPSPAVRGCPRPGRLRSPARRRQGGIRVHRSAVQRRHRRPCLRPRPRSSSRVRDGIRRDERGGVHGIPGSGIWSPRQEHRRRLDPSDLHGLAAHGGDARRRRQGL